MQLGDWIPQFFYDLIARVAPGALLLILARYLLHWGNMDTVANAVVGQDALSDVQFLFGGFIVSYGLGMLLGGLALLIPKRWWKYLSEVCSFRRALRDVPKKSEDEELEPEDGRPFQYDFIHARSPRAGARIAKLNAEMALCRVLCAGFLGLAVIFPILHFSQIPSPGNESQVLVIELALLAAIVGALSLYRYITTRRDNALENNFKLFQQIEPLPED